MRRSGLRLWLMLRVARSARASVGFLRNPDRRFCQSAVSNPSVLWAGGSESKYLVCYLSSKRALLRAAQAESPRRSPILPKIASRSAHRFLVFAQTVSVKITTFHLNGVRRLCSCDRTSFCSFLLAACLVFAASCVAREFSDGEDPSSLVCRLRSRARLAIYDRRRL